MRYFFFGTLLDADVRAVVLGRPCPDRLCRPARLEGYRRVRAAGRNYPMLVPTAGVGVNGLLVAGLSRAEAGRLRYFEGDDYRLARRSTILTDGTACPAHVFLAASSLHPSQTDWDLGAWRLRAKRRFLASAKRRMAMVKFE